MRYNKLQEIFHKLSKIVVQHCIKNNIGTIVIGYNIGWKQNSNMGKRNNQNFISTGITVLEREKENHNIITKYMFHLRK